VIAGENTQPLALNDRLAYPLLALAVETPKPEPERFTPLLYRVQHPLVRFSGGKLISLIGGEDNEAPSCTIASVQVRPLLQNRRFLWKLRNWFLAFQYFLIA